MFRCFVDCADPAPPAGLAFLLAQKLHRRNRVAASTPADQDLGHHHRQTNEQHTGQVDEHEGTAAVLASNVRELPDVAQSNRRSRYGQYERHSR